MSDPTLTKIGGQGVDLARVGLGLGLNCTLYLVQSKLCES